MLSQYGFSNDLDYIVISVTKTWQKFEIIRSFSSSLHDYTELIAEKHHKIIKLIMCFNLVSAVDHNSESEENMQNSLSTNCKLLSIVIGSFTVLVWIQE